MAQSIARDADATTAAADEIEIHIDAAWDWLRPQLVEWGRAVRAKDLTGSVFLGLELHLLVVLREFGRLLLERVLNSREGDGQLLPHDSWYEGQGYRRLGKKTKNAHVTTLFGTLCLWRF